MRRPSREERQKRSGLKARTTTAARANSRDALFGVSVGSGAETGSCEQRAESVFAGSAALGAGDVSLAINHNVYFLTVFLDSPTLIARTMKSFSVYSWLIFSTSSASARQYPHRVVQ